MFAATADQFTEKLRQERWLRLARWFLHPDREQERYWWLPRLLLSPVAAVVCVVYAQALPYYIERSIKPLIDELPWITDRQLLERIEDLFSLYHEMLRKLRPLSLARSKITYWLDELDEQLDMLEFVRAQGPELEATIAEISAHHAGHESAERR